MSILRAASFSIPYGVAGMGRFSGRSRLALFWPYYMACYLFSITATSYVVTGLQLGMTPKGSNFFNMAAMEMQQGAVGSLFGDSILLLLTAAVTVRRLHDSGRSGFWLLAASLPSFIGFSLIASSLITKSGFLLHGSFILGSYYLLSGLSKFISFIVLILLCWPSQPRDNRYGIYEPTDLVDRLWLTRQEVKERLNEQPHFVASDWTP
jgi:uncharacterized membrane protein YhaH (DUF805 family)